MKGPDKKVMVDENGREMYDFKREALVMQSNMEGVKKGDVVYFNPYGAVKIDSQETKKVLVLVVDAREVCAIV